MRSSIFVTASALAVGLTAAVAAFNSDDALEAVEMTLVITGALLLATLVLIFNGKFNRRSADAENTAYWLLVSAWVISFVSVALPTLGYIFDGVIVDDPSLFGYVVATLVLWPTLLLLLGAASLIAYSRMSSFHGTST